MKWVVPVVVGFFVLLFLGFGCVAMFVNSSARISSGYYSGMGAEWEKLGQAEAKGREGWPDLAALMHSSDVSVAMQAALALARTADEEAHRLLVVEVPKLSVPNRETIRSGMYDPNINMYAARQVRDNDSETVEGSLLLLKLSYSRDLGPTQDAVFETLVEAVPQHEGGRADELAYTLSLFTPGSVSSLVAMLNHPEARAKKTAVVALGKMGRSETLSAIEALKSDSDSGVRAAARQAHSSASAAVAKAKAAAATYRTTIVNPDGTTRTVTSESEDTKKRLGMP